MSRHRDGEIPPGVRDILEFIMRGIGEPPLDEAAAEERHREWHQKLIQAWETSEPELIERFGKMIATDLIELTRMANRACIAGESALSSLLMSIGQLVIFSDDDPDVMHRAAAGLENYVEKVEARAVHEAAVAESKAEVAAARARARARARAESNGQPAAEPGTKAKDESKEEAKARSKAEAKTVKFRGKPESN